jgi:hypothetical protein
MPLYPRSATSWGTYLNFFFFHYFIFGLAFESFKERGGALALHYSALHGTLHRLNGINFFCFALGFKLKGFLQNMYTYFSSSSKGHFE